LDLYQSPQAIDWLMLLLGFSVSGISAYFVVYLFIKVIEKIGMMGFVVYRLLLGFGLLVLLLLEKTT
jgi:undecaprenyl-diphosphatase